MFVCGFEVIGCRGFLIYLKCVHYIFEQFLIFLFFDKQSMAGQLDIHNGYYPKCIVHISFVDISDIAAGELLACFKDGSVRHPPMS